MPRSTNSNSARRELEEHLSSLCASFQLIELRDGAVALASPFLFPDGDGYPIIFRRRNDGWIVTDDGQTLGQWDYEDHAVTDARRAQVERAIRSIGGDMAGSKMERELPAGFDVYDLAPFIAAVAAVAGLPGMEPSERADQRFATRARAAIGLRLAQGVQRIPDWAPPSDPDRLFRSDIWIATSSSSQSVGGVAAFFVSTAQKAEAANTSLLRWRELGRVQASPLVVVRDRAPIPRRVRSRVETVAGAANVITDEDTFVATLEALEERGVQLAPAA